MSESTEQTYKKWKSLSDKHVKIMQHLGFLEDCIYFNIVPKFLKIGNRTVKKLFPTEVDVFERTMLKRVINGKKRYSFSLLNKIKELRQKMRLTCSDRDFSVYEDKIRHFGQVRGRIMERNHNRKLGFWLKDNDRFKPFKTINYEYINLTDKKFDSHTDAVLKLGPKYILSTPIDEKDAIASIESAISCLPSDLANQARECAHKQLNKIRKNPASKRELVKDIKDIKCLRKIKNDPEITCIKTDKTGKICILPREKYQEMMSDAIKKMDVITVNHNPLSKLIDKTKDLIKKGKWIDGKPPKIENHATHIPRMFGTFKDHKDPPSIRPIVNRSEGPTKPIEIYMKSVYRNILPPSEYSITSNEQFLKKLRDIDLNNNDLFVSFDVKDLYPSIDLNEIVPIINERIKLHYQDDNVADTLIRANNLLLNESFFQLNNKLYKQTKGVPMGSCVSGIIAELKLRLLEQKITDLKLPIKMWTRYVDDVFCILENEAKPEDLLVILNELDKNIKFTLEKETDGKINFLDVQIIRNNNSISTTVYRKPTKSEEIIHNKCNTPRNFKLAALRSYINRAIMICSNGKLLKEELSFIKDLASKAGYNNNIVKSLYKNRIKALNHIQDAQVQKKRFTTPIPYIKGVSSKIQQISRRSNLIIPVKPNPNIFNRIRNEKDHIDPLEQSGIYQIKFKLEEEDNEQLYVGMTKRRISIRYKEHLRDLIQQKNTTALAQINLKNPINTQHMEIQRIAPFRNYYYAINRESLEIIAKNAINKNESVNLHANWRNLLSTNREGGAPANQERTAQTSGEGAENSEHFS